MKRIRIPLIYKRIWNYFGAFVFATICFIVSYTMFKTGNTELKCLDKHTGTISDKDITKSKSSIAGKTTIFKDVFYYKIDGLNQQLISYNPSQNYTELDNSINIGDTVTAYFKSSDYDSDKNLNTYQLEKNGAIILELKTYTKREQIAAIFVFIMGLFL